MPRHRLPAVPLAVPLQRFRPVGRVVDGTIRPLAVVPGAEHPWVRMGGDLSREALDRGLRAQGLRRGLGQLSQEDLDRGHAILDTTSGEAHVLPGGPGPLARAPWYVNLRPSGSRGIPLTLERCPFEVRPEEGPAWPPQLYPPGKQSGERPRTVASASVNVAAGATVNLITLPELGRGLAAVVKKFGQTANDFTNLTWSFIVKGGVVDPIVGINFQFGQMFLPVDLPGSGVQLGPGDDFIVQVVNTGGVIVNNVRARVDLYEYRMTA